MSDINGSKVANFYHGTSVFITGGTGFVGKTLIEKLLYSCSGIDKIYVLVRDKCGKQATERLARITSTPETRSVTVREIRTRTQYESATQMLLVANETENNYYLQSLKTKLPEWLLKCCFYSVREFIEHINAFDRLKGSRKEELKKITVISGDINRECLGLQDDDLKILEDEVSVVFHLAATVAFQLPLNDAMRININGTENVIQLCRRMKKLEAFVHVSTAFTNADRKEIDEVVYPMPMKLESARLFAEMFSHSEEMVTKFIGKKPNTYTFSKAFAEELVMNQCEDLPAAIIRPSIVVAALKEPCPGWIDSWSGSTGLFVGMSSGVLKVAKGRGSNVTDLVPVDIVTNLVIVAATECRKSKQIKVYNCCTGASNPITCAEANTISRRVALKYRLNEFPWPFIMFTPSVLIYNLITFTLQIIPAYLIDLWCTGKKATQIKLQNKLKKVVDAVKFFLLNEWKFSDNNMKNLLKTMTPEDKETFNIDVKTINWETCIRDYILGARKYLVKLCK